MAKTRLTDEGLVLTNDNGVDVIIKANHAATVDSYVLPPAADGTISTSLSHIRGAGASDLSVTPTSYSTPVDITGELTLGVGSYLVNSQWNVDADGADSPESLGFQYTGTAEFTTTQTNVYGVQDAAEMNPVSCGACLSETNNATPDGMTTGQFPSGNICWQQVLTVTGAGTVKLSATIRDDEAADTYLIKSGFLVLTKL